jgi:CrcB protein
MNALGLVVVFCGAGLGACLRWWMGLLLNPLFTTVPLGTLAANLIGGFLVGVAAAYFSQNQLLPVEWRLFAVTGFLGGLTTFSTFSAEVVTLLDRAQYGWAMATAGGHLIGSLLLTALGMALTRALLRS